MLPRIARDGDPFRTHFVGPTQCEMMGKRSNRKASLWSMHLWQYRAATGRTARTQYSNDSDIVCSEFRGCTWDTPLGRSERMVFID